MFILYYIGGGEEKSRGARSKFLKKKNLKGSKIMFQGCDLIFFHH